MAVPRDLCGTYRQVAHRLRIQSDTPGAGSRDSERPRNKDTGRYLDNDETTVTILPTDAVDVAALLRSGAIVPLPPTPKAEPKVDTQKGGNDGKGRSQ